MKTVFRLTQTVPMEFHVSECRGSYGICQVEVEPCQHQWNHVPQKIANLLEQRQGVGVESTGRVERGRKSFLCVWTFHSIQLLVSQQLLGCILLVDNKDNFPFPALFAFRYRGGMHSVQHCLGHQIVEQSITLKNSHWHQIRQKKSASFYSMPQTYL